jgi:hypothetical protein
MNEVVTFEPVRRRGGSPPGGDGGRGPAEFFNRHELNRILQVYSRRVMSGEWLDYALAWDERGAVFSIFGAASSLPVYAVIKRPRHLRKQGGRYQIVTRGRVLRTDPSIDGALRVLERQAPRLVEQG